MFMLMLVDVYVEHHHWFSSLLSRADQRSGEEEGRKAFFLYIFLLFLWKFKDDGLGSLRMMD